MFYYRTSFSQKAVFLEETEKNPFVGGNDHFEGRGHLATKINITFFCRYPRFEYFLSYNFFEKNNIFQDISEKLFFSGVTIFKGTGWSDDKNEYNLFFW